MALLSLLHKHKNSEKSDKKNDNKNSENYHDETATPPARPKTPTRSRSKTPTPRLPPPDREQTPTPRNPQIPFRPKTPTRALPSTPDDETADVMPFLFGGETGHNANVREFGSKRGLSSHKNRNAAVFDMATDEHGPVELEIVLPSKERPRPSMPHSHSRMSMNFQPLTEEYYEHDGVRFKLPPKAVASTIPTIKPQQFDPAIRAPPCSEPRPPPHSGPFYAVIMLSSGLVTVRPVMQSLESLPLIRYEDESSGEVYARTYLVRPLDDHGKEGCEGMVRMLNKVPGMAHNNVPFAF